MMARTKAQRQAEVLVALEKHLGILTPAAKAADVPRRTVYNWIRTDPDFRAAVEDVQDIALDYVEGTLFRLIRQGNVQATIFFLKTKGKKRGYVEAVETVAYAPDTPPMWFDNSPIQG